MAVEHRVPGGEQASEWMIDTLVAAAQAPLDDWPTLYPGRAAMGYLCSYVP